MLVDGSNLHDLRRAHVRHNEELKKGLQLFDRLERYMTDRQSGQQLMIYQVHVAHLFERLRDEELRGLEAIGSNAVRVVRNAERHTLAE